MARTRRSDPALFVGAVCALNTRDQGRSGSRKAARGIFAGRRPQRSWNRH